MIMQMKGKMESAGFAKKGTVMAWVCDPDDDHRIRGVVAVSTYHGDNNGVTTKNGNETKEALVLQAFMHEVFYDYVKVALQKIIHMHEF